MICEEIYANGRYYEVDVERLFLLAENKASS